ncbi:hypothetical protein [Naasia sp. SYSU D00057]|uniref:hypothetical protein n=1 Tax=Naasia sp. SYSU D00057 TaxID=2817380 RepID=UPI001FEEB148|nr:hypothetical protein [Naasia sp. SYSU D00057]
MLVIAGGAWTLSALFAQASLAGPAATPAPVPTPTLPVEVIDVAAGPVDLVSASGNLWCHFDQDAVQCAVRAVTYDGSPQARCPESAVAVAVALDASGVSTPCVSTVPEVGERLERDVRYVAGDFECVLSASVGAKCTDGEGRGFVLSSDAPLKTLS